MIFYNVQGLCKTFDVSLGKDGSPFIFMVNETKNYKKEKNTKGLWWPICGHFFNNNSATLFCKRLNPKYVKGYANMSMTTTIPMPSVMVGNCTENDVRQNKLSSCSGGCNKYGLGKSCENLNCSAGFGPRVTIKCITDDSKPLDITTDPAPLVITEDPAEFLAITDVPYPQNLTEDTGPLNIVDDPDAENVIEDRWPVNITENLLPETEIEPEEQEAEMENPESMTEPEPDTEPEPETEHEPEAENSCQSK